MQERAIQVVRDRCWPKLAKALLANRPRTHSAILLGPSGCGKTTAARFLCLGRTATWAKGDALSSCEREHSLGAGEPRMVSEAIRAPMLVLDDLRAGQDLSALWRILDRRYDRSVPTIATTGLTQAGLLEHLGPAGLRRLTEQHAGDPVLIIDCHGGAR
jgi:ABC-type iron transport system FetAB ATPase subunit